MSTQTEDEDRIFDGEENAENQENKIQDWESEAENLSEGGEVADYYSPEQGDQEITFLDEGTVYTDEKKYDDSPRQYVKFKVEVDGSEYVWDMAKGSTETSKYGQIAQYAAAKGGLKGETVTWFVQGSGTDTNHVLMDLKDLDSDE